MKLSYPPGATPLDPNEIAGLLPTSIATQGELDAFEQANIVRAERWALKRKRKDLLTDAYMRLLHRRMFGEVWRWAGTYRGSEKNIGVSWRLIPVQLRQLCDDVRYWLEHGTHRWDELGARFHHRLVSIHPFANGNGRHARLMTEVLLMNHDQELFSWGRKTLAGPGQARERYLAALRAADHRDIAPLIQFVRS